MRRVADGVEHDDALEDIEIDGTLVHSLCWRHARLTERLYLDSIITDADVQAVMTNILGVGTAPVPPAPPAPPTPPPAPLGSPESRAREQHRARVDAAREQRRQERAEGSPAPTV